MKFSAACAILPALLASAAPASTVLPEWRTQVQVSNGGNGLPLTFGFDGGLNDSSSAVRLSRSGIVAEASSELSVGGFVPTLRAFVDNTGTRGQAVAWAVQGYTNISPSPLDTTLLLGLTAELSGLNDLRASLYLFQDEGFQFYTDPGTVLFESTSQLWPGFEELANNLGPGGFDVGFSNYAGPVDESRQFDFTVAPGDSFYVYAYLLATADNVGVVDAFSTLTASFSNTSGLTPAVVPEPAAGFLVILGAGMLARRRRG